MKRVNLQIVSLFGGYSSDYKHIWALFSKCQISSQQLNGAQNISIIAPGLVYDLVLIIPQNMYLSFSGIGPHSVWRFLKHHFGGIEQILFTLLLSCVFSTF